jgi:hypothetical protein
MPQKYRAFTAEDIPVSLQGGIAIFNWNELENKLHINIGQSVYVNIMQIVYDVMNDLSVTDFYNEKSLKVNIAARLNTNFYPTYFGIKKDSKINQEYELKYINIDDLLNQTSQTPSYDLMSETVKKAFQEISQQTRPETKEFDVAPYMTLLIDKFGFTYKEAKEIVKDEQIPLKGLMEIIEKVFDKAQDQLRDEILSEAIKRFTK